MNVRLYPACKAQDPYYIVNCGLSGSTIFLHIISKSGQFTNKCVTGNICSDFPYKSLSEKFCSKKRIHRNIIIHVHKSSCKVSYILAKMWSKYNFWQILEKSRTTKSHENPSIGSRVVPYGWTDIRTSGHDEVNSQFLHLHIAFSVV
jgi:hypothetical protein